MPNRGSYNRRTGKSTPRNKGKTHWGKKAKKSNGANKRNRKVRAPGRAKV